VKCPQDGGEIVEKRSKEGKVFWSCSNWPDCRFASWYKPVNEKCPECGAEYLLQKNGRDGKTIHFCPERQCKYSRTIEKDVV